MEEAFDDDGPPETVMGPQKGARILIVEDDEQLGRMLRIMLSQAGHAVTTAATGAEGLEFLDRLRFDLLLLDLNLPDIEGPALIKEAMESATGAPIIVISARSMVRDKIDALDLGAFDYVAKPFDPDELLARIRVALRYQGVDVNRAERSKVVLDPSARVMLMDGRKILLSRREVMLLSALKAADGATRSYDELIAAVWGSATGADINNLRVLAWQIRRKIEPDPRTPQFLISEPGRGYRLSFDAMERKSGRA
jgi:two-component system KDP operon response regulator KdpE